MRKMVRKFMALTMVGVLMVTPLTAFATGTTEETTSPATGNATGEGALEGFLTEDDEIFSVTLPTDDTSAPTFAFTMDPQNLLNKTDSSNYTTTDTVLFSTKTKTSNELSITNNSQFDVDVSLTAKMTGLSGEGYKIDMAADDTFTDANSNNLTNTSLYLGLVYETAAANNVDAVASTTKALVADAAGLTAEVTLGGMPSNYTIGKDGSGNYIYEQIDSPATATGIAKFKMVGACNPNADWSAIDDLETPAAPTVEVVWSVEKHSDSYLSGKTISSSSNVLNVSLPNGVSISSVTLTKTSGAVATFTSGNQYTYSSANGTITFLATMITANTGGTITVTFSDGTSETITIQ